MGEYEILVRGRNSSWLEKYSDPEVTDLDTAWRAGLAMVNRFNDTLQPGQHLRTLRGVHFIGNSEGPLPHEWRKVNLITEVKGGQMFDRYECTRCGVTGKRFGFGWPLRLDRCHARRLYCTTKGETQ
jgi:hypothetical protein